MTVLFRYQIREQWNPLILSVMGISLLFMSGVLFELGNYIVVKHVPPLMVAKLLLYKLPAVIVLTLPVSTLFAALFALGRLAKDRELLIMRMAGMNCRRLLLPPLLLALLISGAMFAVNEYLVPPLDHQAETISRKIMLDSPPPELAENIFFRDRNRFFYIGHVEPQTHLLHNIMIYEVYDDRITRLITARTGRYQEYLWTLYNGVSHDLDSDGFVRYEAGFEQLNININRIDDSVYRDQRSTQEMSGAELHQLITTLHQGGVRTAAFEVDYYLKSSVPLAPFLFVLLGAPLMVRARWHERLHSVGISVAIAAGYYVLVSLTAAAGRAGLIPPVMAAWVVNIIFLAVGVAGVWRADHS